MRKPCPQTEETKEEFGMQIIWKIVFIDVTIVAIDLHLNPFPPAEMAVGQSEQNCTQR